MSVANTLLFYTAAGIVIGFDSMASYTTTETEGEVSLCVSVIDSFGGERLDPFEVILLTEDGIPLITEYLIEDIAVLCFRSV